MLNKQKLKFLRSMAHGLSPVIWIGQHGLSEAVQKEVEQALEHHELVKIKLRVGERAQREAVCDELCTATSAELVQKIGNTLTLYRQNSEEPRIKFPR